MDSVESQEILTSAQTRYKLTFQVRSKKQDLRLSIERLLRFGPGDKWQLKAKGSADSVIPADLIFDSYRVEQIDENLYRLEITAYSYDEWLRRRHTESQPIVIDDDLVVKAAWDRRRFTGKTVINIMPGIAFGSGSHPSTRLCLLALKKFLKPGRHVLDVGCGTGILSIAAAKLGAASVTAVDIDPAALAMARRNASRNRVARRIHVSAEPPNGDLPRRKFNFIVANLTLNLHTELAMRITAVSAAKSLLICGGVTETEADETKALFRAHGFRMRGMFSLGDWRAIVFRHA